MRHSREEGVGDPRVLAPVHVGELDRLTNTSVRRAPVVAGAQVVGRFIVIIPFSLLPFSNRTKKKVAHNRKANINTYKVY